MKNKRRNGEADDGAQGRPERDDVFNTILAMYSGDEEEEVFSELNGLYERYPSEVEFYIP